jgi:hypothetical protein
VDVEVEVVEVLLEVLEVLVELVEVEEVEDDVELVEVEDVEVDVVILSSSRISPIASLYTRPTTPAEVLLKLDWLIARI